MTDNYRRHISCLRKNKLIYARTLKAGSEFFYKNFQAAGWIEVTFDSINWDNETVFSHIMDPIQRRHKGISEVIISTGTRTLLLNNKGNFDRLLKLIPFLDAHSASLHNIYGNNVRKINWLLLTNDHSVAVKETDRFLDQHGVPPIDWNVDFTHNTGSYMSDIYVRVKELWENDPQYDDTVRNYFQPDIELFNEVKAEYDRNNHS
jgi:hypothetical protein